VKTLCKNIFQIYTNEHPQGAKGVSFEPLPLSQLSESHHIFVICKLYLFSLIKIRKLKRWLFYTP
jgi:hypothetical protein